MMVNVLAPRNPTIETSGALDSEKEITDSFNSLLTGADQTLKEDKNNDELLGINFSTKSLISYPLLSFEEIKKIETSSDGTEDNKELIHELEQAIDEPILELEPQDMTEEVEEQEVSASVNEKLVTNEQTEVENSMIDFLHIKDLTKEIATIIKTLTDSSTSSLSKESVRLLPLIKEWISAKNGLSDEQLENASRQELTEKESAVWKQLVNAIEKRSFFSQQNIYSSDASITKTTVLNWLQRALDRYSTGDNIPEKSMIQTHHSQPLPISEVQQYTVQIQQLDRVERVNDDLLNKFQTIIRESQFQRTPLGGTQLSITLQPGNLGNMTVQFVQVDGEIAVKIIVSSQAVRELIESNIHQLKHMFSPHQVLVEKNESINDEEFFYKEADEEHNEHEEADQHFEESTEQQDESTASEDFQTWFQRFAEEELLND